MTEPKIRDKPRGQKISHTMSGWRTIEYSPSVRRGSLLSGAVSGTMRKTGAAKIRLPIRIKPPNKASHKPNASMRGWRTNGKGRSARGTSARINIRIPNPRWRPSDFVPTTPIPNPHPIAPRKAQNHTSVRIFSSIGFNLFREISFRFRLAHPNPG